MSGVERVNNSIGNPGRAQQAVAGDAPDWPFFEAEFGTMSLPIIGHFMGTPEPRGVRRLVAHLYIAIVEKLGKINRDFEKRGTTLIVETRYEHIILNEAQVPLIAGTTMKVVELVLDHKAYGWSPEELHFQHPYLTLGQIYSALAFYWDHQEALDQDIEQRLQVIDQIRQGVKPTPLEAKLKAKGLI